ncbi:RNI-like protein [Pseudovirgaria hyperparasitica]|uniref:RNI-like protein n=1 Tax=Pseudovirgaria hyperparasitica TaxID=470096 RepID=A0A6A6W6B6_9PEZI|nr:RNI-like protein [Pseudovirgaria hyperparasitica]KAF2757729.1 RNI-like protein [Pseudovirgaria hyperparasitica]
MEDIHGVDVSWVHHSNKGPHQRQRAHSSPGLSKDVPPKTSSHGGLPSPPPELSPPESPSQTIPEPPDELTTSSTTPPMPVPLGGLKLQGKRPGMLYRNSSDKEKNTSLPHDKSPKRPSWISSISSKFSQTSVPQSDQLNVASSSVQTTASSNTTGKVQEASEEVDSSPQQSPKSGGASFFTSALRRLSSGTPITGAGKAVPNGGVCPRRVLNVDPNRERCVMPELNNAKLRKVAFCVDVEIAGGPRYKDEEEELGRKKKFNEKKSKDSGEGEALKDPGNMVEKKDAYIAEHEKNAAATTLQPSAAQQVPHATEDKKDGNKKKEKKKRSEAERKERKEKKRRKAEENGQIPMEINQEDSSGTSTPAGTAPARPQSRPTTDPLRIYRRCCQLRETPILKRITEQLAQPSTCPIETPGIVSCLDLTGSRLQLADVFTLSDWLAIVPVKRLLLEDADLGDEAVRVILAGLLAARHPEYPRRKIGSSSRDNSIRSTLGGYQERSGFVEKISLKNNPKVGKEGWKHISLFIYMCRSLRALDVSMIPFGRERPKKNNAPGKRASMEFHASHSELADIFSKAISERLGGSRFEELIMAECSLDTEDVRKIVDAITWSGLKRLSLASNNLSDAALEYVCRYIRSGVPDGLDLGGNDMSNRLDHLCSAFTGSCQIWALSLADCNLMPDSLRPLFQSLITLPNVRFLDLSHNRKLFSQDPSALTILRKYLPQFTTLKRIHLNDCSMKPAQAIGLAEIISEVPHLAHISLLENPQLSALAKATDEAGQEEACALYASLMCAARVSSSVICIDIDVPAQESSEIVKALAKQVVAHCLRNMESWTAADAAQAGEQGLSLEGVKDTLSDRQVEIPEVLLHLVGNAEGGDYDTAPDDDYIVGGTGVVKALSYCLLEKASDSRRSSVPVSGTASPKNAIEQRTGGVKAKNMSRDLLGSARKIRERIQPAIVRESKGTDEMAYKRLLFLDQTLQGIIRRFETEYPDTRIEHDTPPDPDTASEKSSPPSSLAESAAKELSVNTEATTYESESDDGRVASPALLSRHNSDVSFASRALGKEEGHIHRLSQKVRRDILKNSSPSQPLPGEAGGYEPAHISALRAKFAQIPGDELLRGIQKEGWDATFKRMGENAEELRRLQEENPEDFQAFKEAQLAALENVGHQDAEAVRQGGSNVAVKD